MPMPSDLRPADVHHDAPASGDGVRAMLYTLDEHDLALDLADIDPESLSENQLLWIDLAGSSADTIAAVVARMGLPDPLGP